MQIYIKAFSLFGTPVKFEMFSANDLEHAKSIMRANHGEDWKLTHTLFMIEAVKYD